MSIDVAPVKHGAAPQPLRSGQRIPTVTRTEYHHAVRHIRKRKKVRFVLGDEHLGSGDIEGGKARSIQRNVCVGGTAEGAEFVVELPKTYPDWLVAKAVTGGKLRRTPAGGIALRVRDRETEQFRQHAHLRFDEFAMHSSNVN